jgi:hypothetical protein
MGGRTVSMASATTAKVSVVVVVVEPASAALSSPR